MTLAAFTWDDIVTAKTDAPANLRPGSKAWVVGISQEGERSGAYRDEFPKGFVYTIEFEDGSAVEAPEALLQAAEPVEKPE